MCAVLLLFMLHITTEQSCVLDSNGAYCRDVPDELPSRIVHLTLHGKCSGPTQSITILPFITNLILDCPILPFNFDLLPIFPNAETIKLQRCPFDIPWFPFVIGPSEETRFERQLDLTSCNLSCSCANQWHQGESMSKSFYIPTQIIGIAHSIVSPEWECDFTKCPKEVISIPNNFTTIPGHSLTITVDTEPVETTYRYFHFLHQHEAFAEEEITNISVSMRIPNVTVDHMGQWTFVCWHCSNPIYASFAIFVRSNISLSINNAGSEQIIIIHGWPLDNITISVQSEDEDWSIAQHELGNKKIEFANQTLVLQPLVGHSTPFLWQYSLYTRQCSYCQNDLTRGNFSIKVCAVSSSCAVANTLLGHENGVVFENEIAQTSSVVPLWPFITAAVLLTICIICMCTLKLPKAKVEGVARRLRRTSRATEITEDTSLRLEERASLSISDYSGSMIPTINLGNIKMNEKIGQGAFGEVYSGLWTSSNDKPVAVKTINQVDSEVEKEAAVLSKLDHPNIVRLFGMTKDGERILLVFELMNLGDLKTYLRKRRPHPSSYTQFPPALEHSELLFITREIIRGLCYLNAQQIVHRDLAARNCLLSGDDDSRLCVASSRPPVKVKISDFGMSRRLYDHSEYYKMQTQGAILPVRWLPPESVNSCKFSHQSDIWALGVTMWEIFTYGETPFSELSTGELISFVLAGMRPPKPQKCPSTIYALMEKCWAIVPEERITADEALLDPCIQDPTQKVLKPVLNYDTTHN